MNTKQIYKALISNKYTTTCFNGVYSLDTLIDIENKPELIICNTDPSTKPGKHWVLFYFNGDNVEFFDSLGKSIENYGIEFIKFVKRFAKTITMSKVRVQPPNTVLCGHYCLLYAYHRCKGKKMNTIIQKMMAAKNIKNILQKLYYICEDSKCPMLQNCKTY